MAGREIRNLGPRCCKRHLGDRCLALSSYLHSPPRPLRRLDSLRRRQWNDPNWNRCITPGSSGSPNLASRYFGPPSIAAMAKSTNPFRYFDSSPEVIRTVVMMYVKYPLSLRNVEDLLAERGIDICHETGRPWWNRFGPMFAAEIRRKRVQKMRAFTHRRWPLRLSGRRSPGRFCIPAPTCAQWR